MSEERLLNRILSRREVLDLTLKIAGGAAVATSPLLQWLARHDIDPKILRNTPVYIKPPTELTKLIAAGGAGLPFVPTLEGNKGKVPGLASLSREALRKPELGGSSEIYDTIVSHPYIVAEYDGGPVTLSGSSTPLYNRITPLTWVNDDNGWHWDPDPNSRQAFIVSPGLFNDSGNCFGWHNYHLAAATGGRYVGVYQQNRQILLGQEGYNRFGPQAIIGIRQYPFPPGDKNSRLVLYPSKLDNYGRDIGPDLSGPQVRFQCTRASILTAAQGDTEGYGNSKPDKLHVVTCYPPEQLLDSPGRLVMEFGRVD